MLYRTADTIDEDALRFLYKDSDDTRKMPKRIDTASGAWIKEGDVWFWWQDDGETP